MNRVDDVSSASKDHIRRLHGDHKSQWLASVPARLAHLSDRWSLQIGKTNISDASCIAYGQGAEHGAVVVKLVFDQASFAAELAGLSAFAGSATVRLLSSSLDDQALLLERITPGEALSTLANDSADETATSIAADVIRTMHAAVRDNARPPDLRDIGSEGLDAIQNLSCGSPRIASANPCDQSRGRRRNSSRTPRFAGPRDRASRRSPS
jgi:hypothetical protein